MQTVSKHVNNSRILEHAGVGTITCFGTNKENVVAVEEWQPACKSLSILQNGLSNVLLPV